MFSKFEGGGWAGENGTIALLAFFPCFVVIFGQSEANTCYEAKRDLVGFPYFIGISAVLGCWKPNSPFVLVDPQNDPFLHSKTKKFVVPFSVVKSAKFGPKML